MKRDGRKRYFHIDENARTEQRYALYAIFDTEFITEEENTQADSTQHTSLTTPEASHDVVPSENLSKKKEKSKKEESWEWTKKVKVTKEEECHLLFDWFQ